MRGRVPLPAGVVAVLAGITLAAPAGAATRPAFKELTPPPGRPSQIAPGPGGTMWFTSEGVGNYVGRIARSGAITTFPLPTPAAAPDHITRGPDGAMWFAERDADKIGRIAPSGLISEFPLPTAGSAPRGITSGPDGALWFTEFNGDRVGRITTSGAITEFAIPSGAKAVGIVTGRDGNLWFTAPGLDAVGRMTTSGTLTMFPASNASGPEGIAVGPDRALWFTEDDGDRIGRITTSGRMREFVNGITPNATPSRITRGGDGALWFTELIGGRVARITTTGRVTEFAVGSDDQPWGIAAGPRRTIWFAKAAANRIVRFTAPDLPGAPGAMTYDYVRDGSRTRFTSARLQGMARQGRFEARCRGGGCPRGVLRRRGKRSANLIQRFRRPLAAGARIEVRLRAPGTSPKLFLLRTRATAGPTFRVRCLPAGARKPRRCAR